MNKDIQNKLFEELREVVPSKDAHIDFDIINKLSYLDHVVNETFRVLPTIPFATRRTAADIVLDDCTIPKGVQLMIPIIRVHTNPKWWGDDAHLFKPERFERENFKKIHPYAFIPFTSELLKMFCMDCYKTFFSEGHRMCLGWKYAVTLMKINLVHLLMHYEFDTRLKMEELEFKFCVTMNVCQGYQLKITERKY